MFGDCNTYNSNWRDHPNFSWKPQPPQYQQPAQAPQQASILEQAIVNLCKVVGDFVGNQEAINAQINQRIDRVESTLNKRMDEMQNDLSQKLDFLQDSISRLANLNTMQEKENSPSQPYQNSMSIHEMEAKEGEHSQKREVKERKKRGRKSKKEKGKSTEKDDYIDEEPQRIVIKEEMKKHMPPPFLQALFLDDQNQEELQKKLKKVFRSEIGAKTEQNIAKNRGKTGAYEISQPLRKRHFAAKPVRSPIALSAKIFAAAKPILARECHFAAQEPPFRSCETTAKLQSVKIPNFAAKAPFRRVFRSCEADFGTRVHLQHSSPHFEAAIQLRNHFLAHESHFEAPYTHFAAAK
ncbi:hypothetical protein CK203_046151 [Vitis vinifera]|uniref:Uncharacterized protein n=1 Tax=Vitis vinifera TaxID=29760 RepID=A0A438I4D8_VITVI|nr:hypothetical protein CK203_046151 [Vitis vinifera]